MLEHVQACFQEIHDLLNGELGRRKLLHVINDDLLLKTNQVFGMKWTDYVGGFRCKHRQVKGALIPYLHIVFSLCCHPQKM